MADGDTGLLGIGEYTGREAAPVSQTAQQTVQTAPAPAASPAEAQPSIAPAPAPPPPAPPEPSQPQEPKGDLIGDLSKAFAKTIGEVPQSQPQEQAPEVPRVPPEKTWRDAEPPPTTTKKAAEDWRNFKEKAKADIDSHLSRIKSLEKELADERSKTPAAQQQLDEMRKAAQDAMGIVERIAIERSPIFKSKVLDQEALIKARLGQLVDGTGIHPSEVDTILKGDLSTRERVIESRQMSAFRRQQIADTLSKWDTVAEERGKMLERGKETLQTYLREQQQAQENARAQFLRESEQVFENQFSLAKPKLEVYNYIEGNDAWNKSADALKNVARRLYDGNVSREMVAQAAILAPAAVAYQNLLRAAYGQINELKTQVSKLQGVQPTVRDTGGDVMQPAQAIARGNGDFVRDIVDRFRKETGLQ